MARPKTLQVRRIRSKEERKRPSVFMRLKTDEQFRGHALFEPDPELEDNPGFFEYLDHWDAQGNAYVPCAGEDCPFCMANDNPSTRALTLWYFKENNAGDRLKVFTMNFGTIQDVTDISEEEEGILGKMFRVKRLSDRGEYRLRPMTEKPLLKKEITAALKEAPDLEELVTRQLQTQHERLKAVQALEEDEDETETEIPDDEDEEEEEESEESEEEEDDDEEEEEEESDDEEEESDDDEEADDDDEEEEDEDESIKGEEFQVVSTDEDSETVKVKMDGKNTDIWASEKLVLDFDEIKKGATITVDAVKDDEGDWVATKMDVKAKPKTTRKTTTRRKTTAKK